jgi:hypothetical protein
MLNAPSLVQRQTGENTPPGPVARSPFTALNNAPAISRRAAQPLVQRVQNIVAKSSQIQRRAEPSVALSLDRFSRAIVNRFPERASRYEAKAVSASEVVQRAPLPFAGGDSSASDSPASVNAPTAADVEMAALRNTGDEAFYPNVTPQDSVASQLSERLQAFREPGSGAAPSPSPRQISRMTADRVSRRTDSGAPVRRSSIEEVDPKSSSLPGLASLTQAPPASSPGRQRQPAAPPAQPVQRQAQPPVAPTAPTVQRSPEPSPAPSQSTVQRQPASFAGDEPALESSPAMPSLTQQLLQRFQAGRDKWENPTPASDAPAAPRSTPPAVQRTPDSAPAAPVITEHHSRPVRRAAQPPAVQRKSEPAPPAETPAPKGAPAVETPSAPSVQRRVESSAGTTSEPGLLVAPVDSLPVVTPASPAIQPKPQSAEPTPTVKPVAPSTPAESANEVGEASAANTPVIQRTSDPTPTLQGPPVEPEIVTRPPSAPVPVQRATSSDPQGPEPAAVITAPPALQRTGDDLPLRPPSTPTANIPAAPVSTPPVSTQPVAPALASPPASVSPPVQMSAPASAPAPASIQRSPEPSPAASQPGPQPTSPAAFTQSVPRQPAVAQPPASPPLAVAPAAPAAPLSIQRTAGEDGQATMPLAQPHHAAMARTVQRAPAALAEEAPMAVAVREPVALAAQIARKPMAVVQRQSAGTANQTVDGSRANLPLAKITPTPAVTSKVQREVVESSMDSSSDADTAREKAEVRAPSHDALVNLAKQIYPILKRMLAVERERR